MPPPSRYAQSEEEGQLLDLLPIQLFRDGLDILTENDYIVSRVGLDWLKSDPNEHQDEYESGDEDTDKRWVDAAKSKGGVTVINLVVLIAAVIVVWRLCRFLIVCVPLLRFICNF